MHFIHALVSAKKLLKLSDTQIAKDSGVSRPYINDIVHRKVLPTKKTQMAVTYALCKRIEDEILMHKNQIDSLKHVMDELKAAAKEG